jgi:lipopolysaccharide heptosyltransferase I
MNPANILVVRLSSFGDIVHTVPAVAALRSSFQQARIDWLVDIRYREAAELPASVDRVIRVDRRRLWGSGGIVETVRLLRGNRYDVAIDFQGLMVSALLTRLSGAIETVGFARGETREWPASLLYSRRHDPKPYAHVVEKNLRLLGALGLGSDAVTFPMGIPFKQERIRRSRPLAIIHPGSSAMNKNWPPENFGTLAKIIQREYDMEVLIALGPREEGLGNAILRIAGESVTILPATPIADLASLMREATIYIGCDSGPTHLAAAIGIPVVAIHGPTDPSRNGPWGQLDSIISRFGQCECRFRRRCRRSEPCIATISVEEVHDVVRRKLEQRPELR